MVEGLAPGMRIVRFYVTSHKKYNTSVIFNENDRRQGSWTRGSRPLHPELGSWGMICLVILSQSDSEEVRSERCTG